VEITRRTKNVINFELYFLISYYKMPKAHAGMTIIELKAYVRSHKINKPEIKISMNKAQLIAGLKKHGHWGEQVPGGAPASRKARKKQVKVVGKQKKLGVKKSKADADKARKNLKGMIGEKKGKKLGKKIVSKSEFDKARAALSAPAKTARKERSDKGKKRPPRGRGPKSVRPELGQQPPGY
jgi:hypothetical protein